MLPLRKVSRDGFVSRTENPIPGRERPQLLITAFRQSEVPLPGNDRFQALILITWNSVSGRNRLPPELNPDGGEAVK